MDGIHISSASMKGVLQEWRYTKFEVVMFLKNIDLEPTINELSN